MERGIPGTSEQKELREIAKVTCKKPTTFKNYMKDQKPRFRVKSVFNGEEVISINCWPKNEPAREMIYNKKCCLKMWPNLLQFTK